MKRDTSPEAERFVRERYRAMPSEKRLLTALYMFDTAQARARASLPSDLSKRELRRCLCERFYGVELARKVYPESSEDSK
jgi:hypothetical protein